MFTKEIAKQTGDALNVDWDKTDLEQLHMGMEIEREHGTKYPRWNITDDNPVKTAKIVLAHLEELPDYYTRLKRMEEEGEKSVEESVIDKFLKDL